MAQRDFFRSPPPAWNAKRVVGPKPPFKAKHVWAILQQLKANGRVRDLALFDCGIDAKLRGCDLVKLRVSDVAPGGALRQRATVIQQKTGRPVPFEITDTTREALTAWLHTPRPPHRRLALPEPQPPRRSHQHASVCSSRRPLGRHD